MYTLFAGTRQWSSWSLRPYLALRAAGVPFRLEVIRLRIKESPTTRETILAHSPSGKVPALEIAEQGRTLTVWDSLAICETLAERHPEARLWPQDAGVRAVARAYACEMHSGFGGVREQLTMEFASRLPLPELRAETQDQIARILSAWEIALGEHKGDFLFGGFSIADAMYAPVVSRFETYGVAVSSPVRAYMDRVLALPGMAEWRRGAEDELAAGLV